MNRGQGRGRRAAANRERRSTAWFRRGWGAGVLVLAVLVAGAGWIWQRTSAARELRAALPTLPDLRGVPEILRERLAAADARARGSSAATGALAELGRLYHANGFAAEAEVCWQLLCARQPAEARWWYYRAVLRLAESDYEAATELLRATLARAPDYSPAYLQRANLQLKTGELAGAERDFRRRLELLPRDPYARLGLVRIALQQQRSDEARTLLEALLRDDPNFSSAHSLYSELLAAAGDSERAGWHRWLGVETIRYTEPEDAWLDELQPWCFDYSRLCVLGSIASMREQRAEAQALFERAMALNPGAFDAYQLWCALQFKQKRPAAARDLLLRVRPRLDSPVPTAWFTYLCQAHTLLGDPAAAEAVAREGLALQGDSPELLESLGLALAERRRHGEAVAAYRAALRQNPNDASINYNLAVSLLALHRLDDVLEALDRSLTLQPTFPPTLLLRGRIEMAAEHWPEAERYLRPLVESHPEHTEARELLAECLRQRPGKP